MRGVVIAITRTYFRAQVIGAEHVPPSGPSSCRPSTARTSTRPFVALVTPRRLRYMGKESLWKAEFGAWFLIGAGGFPVQAGHGRP